MTDQEIIIGLGEVFEIVRPGCDFSSFDASSRLREDVGLDSLSMLLMGMAVENKFGVRGDDTVQFVTLGDVIAFIHSQTEEAELQTA